MVVFLFWVRTKEWEEALTGHLSRSATELCVLMRAVYSSDSQRYGYQVSLAN